MLLVEIRMRNFGTTPIKYANQQVTLTEWGTGKLNSCPYQLGLAAVSLFLLLPTALDNLEQQGHGLIESGLLVFKYCILQMMINYGDTFGSRNLLLVYS